MTTAYYRQQHLQQRGGSYYHASVHYTHHSHDNNPYHHHHHHHLHHHHPPASSAAPPATIVRPICAGAMDNLICESTIAQALSERNIFGPFTLPPAIHIPSRNKHAVTHRRQHLHQPPFFSSSGHFWPPFPDDRDPLEATTREPWDSQYDEAMEDEEEEAGGGKQEPSQSEPTTSLSDDYHPYFCCHHDHHHPHQQQGYSNSSNSHQHTYCDTGRTDLMDHDQLHRRASTISDTITTSSTEISRRFSNTSSILTDASSVIEEEPDKTAAGDKTVLDEPQEEEEEEEEQEEPAQEPQPIWADPARVRDNPSRYESVQAYMKQHGIAPDSPMPLSSAYTFYFWDSSQKTTTTTSSSSAAANYMQAVKPIFDCTTVWDFSSRWRRYKHLRGKPGQMLPNQNLYCFVKGVQPMWEDVRNRHGGRLTLSPTRPDLDEVFEWTLASFVGGNLEPYGMVGLVLSRRGRGDRVELWLERTASEDVQGLKARLCQHLAAPLHDLVMGARFKKHFDNK